MSNIKWVTIFSHPLHSLADAHPQCSLFANHHFASYLHHFLMIANFVHLLSKRIPHFFLLGNSPFQEAALIRYYPVAGISPFISHDNGEFFSELLHAFLLFSNPLFHRSSFRAHGFHECVEL